MTELNDPPTGSTTRRRLRWLFAAIAGAAAFLLATVAFLLVATVTLFPPRPDPCSFGVGVVDGAPVAVGPGGPLTIRAATWNAHSSRNTTGSMVAAVRAIGESADVIGLQEYGSRMMAVEDRLGSGWGHSSVATGILWRANRYQMLAQGSVRAFGVERIENGASGTSLGPKSVNWVQLQDRQSGSAFTFINHHLPPTVEKGGKADRSKQRRLKLYERQMSVAFGLASKFRAAGPVVMVADWNVAARADARVRERIFPYAWGDRTGFRSNFRTLGYPTRGSHANGRHIDYGLVNVDALTFTSQKVLSAWRSDHRAVAFTATSRPGASVGAAAAALTGSAESKELPARLTVPGPGGKGTLTLQGEQVANAAVILEEGLAAGLPERAGLVALATALQESGIRNLDYGDRDSEGMFQQRPSTGWGTPAQVRDPRLATRAFYGVASHTNNPGLTDIAGWAQKSVAAAAQAVQRSGFPFAYARWEQTAQAIVRELAGGTTGAGNAAVGCDPGDSGGGLGNCPPTSLSAEARLTPDASLVLRCTAARFPRIQTFYGDNGDQTSDHGSGRAIDIMISGAFANHRSAEAQAYGWEIANWTRENATALGVHYVIFAAKIWNVERDAEGWRAYRSITGTTDDSAMHFNHVHTSVYGNRGTGLPADVDADNGAGWVAPLPQGRYVVGCSMRCYSGHTGQDFEAATGVPVLSSTAGRVIQSKALKTSSGAYRSYGNVIVVEVAGAANTHVYYAHLNRRDVQTGDTVRPGQPIGTVGSTGNSKGPHLHFEIRVGGQAVDPIPILRREGVRP